MATWREFDAEQQALAANVRERFDVRKHKTLATLRADGSPRISGIEIEFADGEIYLGMMPDSVKLHDLRREFDCPFLLVNADILTKCDFREMLKFHERHRAVMTVGTVPYTVDMPYGILEVDGERLAGVTEKPRFDFVINAGIYVVSPLAIELTLRPGGAVDVPEVINRLMELKQHVVAFPIREYWLDVGRHPDFEKANRDVAEGLLE